MKLPPTDIESRVAPTTELSTGPVERPLADCVRDAMEMYFDALGDNRTTGLHEMVLRQVERPLIEVVLTRTRGNQSTAAQILGLSRGTLRKKIREYGL
jgi:Fis family transcriptional regulator